MLSFIPSPDQSVWFIGPFPLRAYALFIVIGIFVAIRWGQHSWVARGGDAEDIINVAMYAVPSGIIGGRLYHVISDWQIYFGDNGRGALAALRIWDGGLGIWGAIALGFLGSWYAAKKYELSIRLLADSLAPGIAVAQAIGRFGNYFNQELFGAPTTVPWALEIDPQFRPDGYEMFQTFHPTFLYESLWCLALAFALVQLEKRVGLKNGQVFALYVAFYTLGRVWIEMLRIDTANTILGIRLNVFTALVVGLLAISWFIRSRRALNRASNNTNTPNE